MSSFSTAKPKKINPLDRVIKKNPKYDHVQSTLDTGSSLTKYLKKIEEIKTNYRYQQDEIFKRMKITTFVQLLLQVAEVDSIEKDSIIDFDSQASEYGDNSKMSKNAASLAAMTDRSLSPVPSLDIDSEYGGTGSSTRHSTLQGVIRGVGELDSYGKERYARKFANAERNLNKLQQDLDLPYLLLDMRDKDEYEQCHMISALSYPMAMLSRSVNNETAELLAYKNQPGKIIVIYDDDERFAPKAATTLCQRGYDNLFLLSGGLKLASKKFPEGLIVGVLPSSFGTPSVKDSKSTTRSVASAISNGSIMSNISSLSKKTFDRDDIEKLNSYLDNSLMPNERGRLTAKSSRQSTAASVSSVKTLTSIHEKPFR